VSTILFVDDHHAFRTVFAEVLRNAGYTVLEAATAAEAAHVCGQYKGSIDVLIAEAVLLTTANGLAVLRRVEPSHPEIRVLFISEESADRMRQEGLLPDGTYFLQKPFESARLLGALRELLISERADPKATHSPEPKPDR
jgi:two-component system, cell cycle sensor histidine kinase and response regulator CckA